MEIKKEDIVRLRKTSGQPIMDCKKALQETTNFDDAFEYLRKTATEKIDSRRKDRITSEGRVIVKCSHEQPVAGSRIAMVSLLCETDFAAKSSAFLHGLESIANAYLKGNGADEMMLVALKALEVVKAQTGEKIELGQCHVQVVKEGSPVYSYVHFDNKKASLVTLDAISTPYEVQQLGLNLAMHVVATQPRFCLEADIDWSEADLEIPARLLSKPPSVIEKISRGKRDKFMKETCMLYQPYCLDDSMNVKEAILKVRKQKMMEIELKQFKHIEIGI